MKEFSFLWFFGHFYVVKIKLNFYKFQKEFYLKDKQ